MDSSGNIYHLFENDDRESVMEKLSLVEISEDELAEVNNMSIEARKVLWKERFEKAS